MELRITLTGTDRPGLSAALFDALAPHDVDLVDLEQVVLQGHLVLGAVVEATDEAGLRASMTRLAGSAGVSIEVSAVSADRPARVQRHHVTVLAHVLPSAAMSAVVHATAACAANIDRVVRLSAYPITSFELLVSGGDGDRLKQALAGVAVEHGVDVAVQPASLYRRAKRLVVMDVDSTLIRGEVIEMLAAAAGPAVAEQVAAVTAEAMEGRLDFEQSLRARVALLEGLPASVLDDVREAVVLQRGAATLVRTLKRLGYQVGIVSGGFTAVTDSLKAQLGLDFAAANELEVVDGRLTGRVLGAVVDRAGKARELERMARLAGVPLEQTIAVGDGANDLDMLERAGLGVAFNAKPVVRAAADTGINVPYLDAILFLLGITREEIEAADSPS